MTQFNTLQEAFQYAVEKLAIQAKRSVTGDVGSCMYFMTDCTGEKLRCAVGHLMPDTLEPAIGRRVMSIRNLVEEFSQKNELVAKWVKTIKSIYNVNAFEALQYFHDTSSHWRNKEAFITAARNLFYDFNLTLDESKLDFSNWKS